MAALDAILDEVKATLEGVMGTAPLGESGFQVVVLVNLTPGDRSIDIYPAPDFRGEGAGFGEVAGAYVFTVRARVNGDVDGAQRALLPLMDDEHALCLAAALQDDQSLNGLATSVSVVGPTGFGWQMDSGVQPMIGCTWEVSILNVTT